MSKTPKSSTAAKKPPKKVIAPIKTFREEMYLDMFTLRQKPVHPDYLEKFALEWITVAMNNEDMLTIKDFLILKGVSLKTVLEWCERSPVLKQAHDHVIDILGNRRERGAIKKQYDSTIILKSQHMYDKAWQASEEWRAQLAAKVAGASGNVTIEMTPFPNSDLVPSKDKE